MEQRDHCMLRRVSQGVHALPLEGKCACFQESVGMHTGAFIFFGRTETTMPYASRNDIYEAVIRRMVTESLQAQEEQFALEHENDTDEQLLTYVRVWAQKLGHSPWPREIAGGEMILKRFGSWDRVLQNANLRQPVTANKPSAFARYHAEERQQKMVYRQKKALKKQKAQQRLKEQEERKQKREKEKRINT